MRNDLTIGMAGSGGDGIVSAGESLMVAAARNGLHAIMTKSFGSQIRGGESSCRVRLCKDGVLSAGGVLDLAVALNWEDFVKFGAELPVSGATTIVYEAATGVAPDRLPLAGVRPAASLAVPFTAMAKESSGSEKAKNTVVLGLLSGWLGMDPAPILDALRRKLGKKGEDVLLGNERAFETAREYAAAHPLAGDLKLAPAPAGAPSKLLADGNETCAAGALFAGCTFFGGYPITPSTEIMQALSRDIWKFGGVMLQAEDEIAGIGAVVGASFAGKKAMTATSGPGMSLKTEMLGLATIAEIPLVCVNVQRGGPSTGIPTKSEQSDLFQAVFSAHGDVIRPVLAPTSARDAFLVTVEAFNIAEQFQTPVIVLSDQEIAQRKETMDPIDLGALRVVERVKPSPGDLTDYKRFRLTESGVSPMSHPGMEGGNYLASGIEHNERGAPTASGDIHARMNDKRIRKLLPLQARKDLFQITGDPAAPIALVAWGSLAGIAAEALRLALVDGVQAKLLVPRLLFPVAEGVYREFFASVQRGLIVEQSHLGQLHRILRMYISVPPEVEAFARSGSNPITPQQVAERLRELGLDMQRRAAPEHEPEID